MLRPAVNHSTIAVAGNAMAKAIASDTRRVAIPLVRAI